MSFGYDLLKTRLNTPRHTPDTIEVFIRPLDNSQENSRHPPDTILTPKDLDITYFQLS